MLTSAGYILFLLNANDQHERSTTVMNNRLALVSYSLATLAGACLVSGLAILASEKGNIMWTD